MAYKKRPNYFIQNEQRKGKNFLDFKNAKNIENDAPRIFRDLARGNIDIENQGYYFLNPYLLNNLINVANTKLTLYNVSYQAIQCLIYNITYNRQNISESVLYVENYHKLRMEAYNIIFNGLLALKNDKDLKYLYIMANNLKNYKYII